jgi:diguanylate cyclase (GGDEF)-like protein
MKKTLDSTLLASLRQHLEGLKRTPDGQLLYNLIERAMQRYSTGSGQIEQAFAVFLHTLLTRCANDPKYNPATRVKARLIQQRLALHLPSRATPPPSAPETASANPPVATATEPPAEPTPETSTSTSALEQASVAAEPEMAAAPPAEVEHLAADVAGSLTGSDALNTMLAGEQQAMDRLDNAITDFTDLKQMLVKGLDDLLLEREQLKSRLSAADRYMKEVEHERAQLRAEVEHARRNSMADPLTGLPLREMFVRALEAEVGRVKRYGFSLVLALLDIDGLEAMAERFGRDSSDAVLRCYANEVLTIFRSYDLVARYGDASFAILFPNTQRDGAMRALEKVQKRANETYLSYQGNNFPLPGFSSVLAIYAQGEKPAALLKRAFDALANARLKGRGRTVVSLPAS